MTPSVEFSNRLAQADACRNSRRWQEALGHYHYAEVHLSGSALAAVKHNLAICCLALGEAASALAYCDAALALNQALWQSEVVKAKALKDLGQAEQSIAMLAALMQRLPTNENVRLELAAMTLHELGDAALSQRLVEPLLSMPDYAADARLTSLMARLYDRDQPAEQLTRDLQAFATDHIVQRPTPCTQRQSAPGTRKRVGLISPQFSCSPVYFFCIGALRLLAAEYDLIFFNRGVKSDWATREFSQLAAEWFDVARLDGESLAAFLRKQGLDTLLDMGGWMDTMAMRALSTKPAKRLYKWVGGQSATTGLAAFDGMFTDLRQSAPSQQHLYTEPLVFLDSGYVSYSAPEYMPAPALPAGAKKEQLTLGVIANPAKVSRAFLAFLKRRLAELSRDQRGHVTLRFIDKRYRHAQLQQRIKEFIYSANGAPRAPKVAIEFVVPQDHPEYLTEVSKLSAVLDTFPYTGGLTTIEALALGVPCFTRVGTLFSERHAFSHCSYAGMELKEFDLDGGVFAGLFDGSGKHNEPRRRKSLIARSSARLDHAALANAMGRYLAQ
jgi:predicted O-linked N-acetylglucosamine transferase (SPINDLY family)